MDDEFPSDIANQCNLRISVQGFSTCSEWDIVERAEYDYDDETFKELFAPVLWFDGNIGENDKYVWIGLLSRRSNSVESITFNPIELRCVASVVDASGNKRFPQSLAYASDSETAEEDGRSFAMLGFDKYIGRSFLLCHSSELLPDGTLTICLDIDYEIRRRYWSSAGFEDFGHFGHCFYEDGEFCIIMDSAYGRNLCKLSGVFQHMAEVTEGATVPIKPEERHNFQLIHHIVKKDAFIVSTIGGIGKIYIFADKYDMQPIMQICRDLMMSVLLAIHSTRALDFVSRDIHEISELAERFTMDEGLKDILKVYSDIVRKFDSGTGEPEASGVSKVETEWVCEYKGNYFQFSKKKCVSTDFHK